MPVDVGSLSSHVHRYPRFAPGHEWWPRECETACKKTECERRAREERRCARSLALARTTADALRAA